MNANMHALDHLGYELGQQVFLMHQHDIVYAAEALVVHCECILQTRCCMPPICTCRDHIVQ